ncbi:hypothetical protein MKW94_017075 [Papaver nudicaule]|uniref:DUF3444 domain-containing protein n=1 Tax=Papaver nudicaule TaxID=74823 RepID=A0AA42AUZ4_PAPNU|nr:hypothetical protein [Papaver nudicaule]
MHICCGIFSSTGATTVFDDTARFSHLAKGAVARTRNKYEIYPLEGEVWAIYSDINSELSSSDLQTCQYGIGMVVKVNALNGTFKVLLLEKVSGYLTVFKVQRKAGHESLLEIPRCESLRFSHQIPAFPLTDEKDGTLRGCWKLDPRAIPVFVTCLESDSSTFCKETVFSDRGAAMETNSNGVGTNPDIADDQRPLGPLQLDHYEIGQSSQFSKSKKRKNSKDRNTVDGGRKSVRGNSPAAIENGYHRKRAQGASGITLDISKAANVSDGLKRCDGSTFGSKDVDAHAKEMTPDCVDVIPSSVNGQMQIPSPPAHLKMSNVPETEFFNFNDQRSPEKFKTGQIWALYFKLENSTKSYARIESAELFPEFKLTIKWLESSHPPKGVIPWVDKAIPVCCGTFKVAFGEGVVLNNSISFCHQVSGVPSGDNSYTIYPRAGQVWALHSKFCSDLICSNLKICEYYMVEILEVLDDRWIIVSILQSVAGFKTVFKAKERDGLDFTAIPWVELYRFSHQVPSFMLKEARYAELRGCWELDPRSMPVHFYSSNQNCLTNLQLSATE